MRKPVKSRALADKLFRMVDSGEFAPGMKLPCEVKLAERFGVSRDTLRSAMLELEEKRIVERVRGRGTVIRNPMRRCESVKVILPGPGPLNEFMAKLMRGVLMEAGPRGIRVETVISTFDHNPEHMDLQQFRSLSKEDNIILPQLHWWEHVLPVLAERGCRVVAFDRQCSDNFATIEPYVRNWKILRMSLSEIMRESIRIVTGLGCRRPVVFRMSVLETKAFFDELSAHGLPFDSRQFIPYQFGTGVVKDWRETLRNLKVYLAPRLEQAFFNAHADCVIVNNGDLLEALFPLLDEFGLRVPEDIPVLAVQDYPRHDPEKVLPVSALCHPMIEAGKRALQCFFTDYFAPETIEWKHVFLERESTRKGAGDIPPVDLLPEFSGNKHDAS